MSHIFPNEQEIIEIKRRLREILAEQGLKGAKLEDDENDDYILTFTYKKINYQIYIESNDCIHYSIRSIEDCDYSDQFFDPLAQVEDIPFFEEFLFQIEQNSFIQYRNLWLDLEKIQAKYEGVLDIDFEDIIKDKFSLY